MELKQYFETIKGTGVLSTAAADGKVDSAIYSRPHFMDDGTIGFIMKDRLSHANLQENPHAAYLFIEETGGYKGRRLFITKVGEDTDMDKIMELKRRKKSAPVSEKMYLVYFKIDQVLPLIGTLED